MRACPRDDRVELRAQVVDREHPADHDVDVPRDLGPAGGGSVRGGGQGGDDKDQVGFLGGNERAIFGRGYAAEPDVLIAQLKADEGVAEADTLLLTVPNQLGVDYNAHVLEAILKHVAPGLGWR